MEIHDGGFYGTMRMDNGEEIPETVAFRNETYDEKERIFKGEIDWDPSTIRGIRKEIHHFKFSDHNVPKYITDFK